MPLPPREEQLQSAIRYFRRDGLVLIKDRPGDVADDLEQWMAARGIPTERHRRTLGRAVHWEIRVAVGCAAPDAPPPPAGPRAPEGPPA